MRNLFTALFLLLVCVSYGQQKVISLYEGAAPGSESWTWDEKVTANNKVNERVIYNISHPTITVFLPDSAAPGGTAIIICPGGAFQILSIDQEGYNVAHWLNKKGITAFVLKYRLAHTLTDNPIGELFAKQPNSEKFNEDIKPIVAMDIADGEAALVYVKLHAQEYHVSPNRIGIIGFSAGGTVAAGIAFNYSPANRPDFVAPIYPYIGSFSKTSVPKDAPPLFTLAAADDQFGFDKHSIGLYNDWTASKHIAELHIYSKGGHGFGMRKQDLPTDHWIDRFYDWLKQQGF